MKDVKNIMHKPITISKDSQISDAIKQLLHHNISRLLVSENSHIIGIITERDIGFMLRKDETERNIDEIPLVEVIKPLAIVPESTPINEASKIMLDKEVGSLSVESKGQILGIFTKTDLVKYYADNYAGNKKVKDSMTRSYVMMYSDKPIYKVVSKMFEKNISRIILKNHDDIPEGIMTFRDLFEISLDYGTDKVLEDNTRPDISLLLCRRGFVSKSGFGEITPASKVMKKSLISVLEDMDLAEACKILLKNKINGVGVLSNVGKVIGVLSKTDVVHTMSLFS